MIAIWAIMMSFGFLTMYSLITHKKYEVLAMSASMFILALMVLVSLTFFQAWSI